MHKGFLAAGAAFGGLAVALGAFGAHGLEKITSDAKLLHSYHTGVQYQLYHAFALLATGILFNYFSNSRVKWAGRFFVAGILLFSGSLYLITFLKIQQSGAVRFIGPVTPLGGILLVAGWLFLLMGTWKSK
jgi:uncharacterized membrane protein YgdD (TMEM256/DUF423 family)